ncbi:hypothetical protein TNCV_1864531 [Trichonephila clavipes]|nr:hypothetical protein TNCV_1864531 [Trichonephila clavipes]
MVTNTWQEFGVVKSQIRVPVPSKSCLVDELIHIKSVEAHSPPLACSCLSGTTEVAVSDEALTRSRS